MHFKVSMLFFSLLCLPVICVLSHTCSTSLSKKPLLYGFMLKHRYGLPEPASDAMDVYNKNSIITDMEDVIEKKETSAMIFSHGSSADHWFLCIYAATLRHKRCMKKFPLIKKIFMRGSGWKTVIVSDLRALTQCIPYSANLLLLY